MLAAHALIGHSRISSFGRHDAGALKDMEPFIGHLPLNRINSDTFARYRSARRNLSVRTRNQKIALAGRILQLAATVLCFPGTNLTWLARTPEILLEKGHRARQPYPLDEREQQLLLSELPAHAVEMVAFAINTGVRNRELCQLKWSWERRISTPDMPTGWRSIFVLPGEVVNNAEPRVIVLNEAHDKGFVRLAVTPITLAEVLTGPLSADDEVPAERYRSTLKSWFVVDLDPEIAESAARLRAALKLKLAHAVQAASALAIGADALVTHDRDFSAVRDLRVLGIRRDSPPK